MSKPKVMILLTCEYGHQVEVFPDKVLRINDVEAFCGRREVVECVWECPRCEKPKVNNVELV